MLGSSSARNGRLTPTTLRTLKQQQPIGDPIPSCDPLLVAVMITGKVEPGLDSEYSVISNSNPSDTGTLFK